MLIVDDSQAATTTIPYLRDGLSKFIDRMQGKAKIGLVTIGERPTSVVEYTTDAVALKKGVNRIFARPGSGAYLLEGVRDVSRGFKMREGIKRPVIIALTVEGIEFSNLQYERVLDDLRASGATFHALAIGTPAAMVSDELRNRGLLLAEGTKETGGRRDQLLRPDGDRGPAAAGAGELLTQYVVTYGRPDKLIPPEKVQVTTTKPGLDGPRTHSRQREIIMTGVALPIAALVAACVSLTALAEQPPAQPPQQPPAQQQPLAAAGAAEFRAGIELISLNVACLGGGGVSSPTSRRRSSRCSRTGSSRASRSSRASSSRSRSRSSSTPATAWKTSWRLRSWPR